MTDGHSETLDERIIATRAVLIRGLIAAMRNQVVTMSANERVDLVGKCIEGYCRNCGEPEPCDCVFVIKLGLV